MITDVDQIEKIRAWAKPFVFPFSFEPGQKTLEFGGITKRELFAAMVMQGVTNPHWGDLIQPTHQEQAAATCARVAVLCADALLSELEKPLHATYPSYPPQSKTCDSVYDDEGLGKKYSCSLFASHQGPHESPGLDKPKRFWR